MHRPDLFYVRLRYQVAEANRGYGHERPVHRGDVPRDDTRPGADRLIDYVTRPGSIKVLVAGPVLSHVHVVSIVVTAKPKLSKHPAVVARSAIGAFNNGRLVYGPHVVPHACIDMRAYDDCKRQQKSTSRLQEAS